MSNLRQNTTHETHLPAEALLVKAERAVSVGLEVMLSSLQGLQERMGSATSYDTKLGSHVAYLTEHATRAMGELRKLASQRQAELDQLSPDEQDELLVDLLSSMPSDRRERVVERIKGMLTKGVL